MRAPGPLLRTAATVTLVTLLAACTGTPPVIDQPQPSGGASAPTDPQSRIAALAATAQDLRYVATYTYTSKGRAARTVLVSIAGDGTWRVDVPGGALSGAADIAMVGSPAGTYQCLIGGSATPGGPASASPTGGPTPASPGCVRVAAPGGRVPRRYDPVVEHLFTDWLLVLTDRNAPIDVGAAAAGPHVAGACFSVQSSSASLAPPMAAGVYCFTPDGTLTGATISTGSIVIDHGPVAAPPTNTLPGPIEPGPALPIKAPQSS